MAKDQRYTHIIKSVEPGSIADELGVEPGDMLLSVNDCEVEDVFDYRYLTQDEEITMVIRKASAGEDGEPEDWELEIEKDPSEDLGIGFESGLMDEYRSCRNRCIFCFVNQMPKGMRSTLYFHDDDARLSFLQGNYITLTNMSDHDIDRIIRYHLEPINISFHTMNPQLRCRMLCNRTAGDVFPKIRRLKEAGIELNGQIVLCRGINDAEELEYSLAQFEQYLPELRSVSVVPVGLTKYRDGLPALEPFRAEDACVVIDQIERWQRYYMEHYGTHLVHASDEWYILAGREMPPEEQYDGYLQLENGVGMVRLLMEEVRDTLRRAGDASAGSGSGYGSEEEAGTEDGSGSERKAGSGSGYGSGEETGTEAGAGSERRAGSGSGYGSEEEAGSACGNRIRHVTIATGTLAAPILEQLTQEIMEKYPYVQAEVVPITNHFFGELITVSGLITGQDLVAQLRGRDLGERLLLPSNMLRSGENVLLDDMTVEQVEESLQIKVDIVESDGQSLVEAVTGRKTE